MIRRIRYRSKAKRTDIIYMNEKFVAAGGTGKAKYLRKTRR